jgi:hypothetical protein
MTIITTAVPYSDVLLMISYTLLNFGLEGCELRVLGLFCSQEWLDTVLFPFCLVAQVVRQAELTGQSGWTLFSIILPHAQLVRDRFSINEHQIQENFRPGSSAYFLDLFVRSAHHHCE